jgi:hypothetical protein
MQMPLVLLHAILFGRGFNIVYQAFVTLSDSHCSCYLSPNTYRVKKYSQLKGVKQFCLQSPSPTVLKFEIHHGFRLHAIFGAAEKNNFLPKTNLNHL